MNQLSGLSSYVKEYKISGLCGAIITANELADELNVDKNYNRVRFARKTRQFDYESRDEVPITNERENFRIIFFDSLLDHANNFVKERLNQFTVFKTNFGFLYDIKQLKSLSDDEIMKHCKDLALLLTCDVNGELSSDLDGIELYDELNFFKHVIPEHATAIDALKFAVKTGSYPNTVIAYRIMLTIPITVASAERSFSVLKLIKTSHRCTMTQDRLDDLAMLSIEKRVLVLLKLDDIRDSFASKKARKINFQ